VLALGDELMDPKLPNDADSHWLSQGGRDMPTSCRSPRPRRAKDLRRLADAVKRARQGHSSTSSVSRAR
jgi:hypothetical protein